MLTKVTKEIDSSNPNPLHDKEIVTEFWTRFLAYFSLGLLWAVTAFGLLFTPTMLFVASRHSYMVKLVDSSAWIYFYIVIALYTVMISFYLGIRGYNSKFPIVIFFNFTLLIGFIVATFISISSIFY